MGRYKHWESKGALLLRQARSKEYAIRILSNIISKTGGSVALVKVIVERIKSF